MQQHRNRGEMVRFHHLVEFVRFESRKVNDPVYGKDALSVPTTSPWKKAVNRNSTKPKVTMATSEAKEIKTVNEINKVCWFRAGSHSLIDCPKLKERPLSERIEFLKRRRLCFGCLKVGHMKNSCNMKARCNACNGRHPTLLHVSRDVSDVKERQTSMQSENRSEECTNVACDNENESQCTMAIIPVRVRLSHGLNDVVTYAFLDPGSSVSFCSEALMKKLCGVGRRMHIRLDTMGEPHNMDTYLIEGLEVQSLDGQSSRKVQIPRLYTKSKLPVKRHHIPTHDDVSQWTHLRDIYMPQINSGIDLLIGNNVPDAYTPLEVRTGPIGSPHATKTILGWVAWSVVRSSQKGQSFSVNFVDVAAQRYEEIQKLNSIVRESLNFDFPERVIDDKREWSHEDNLFMKKMDSSCKMVEGHYQIGLPFKNEVNLPNNSIMALRRLKSLERKLKSDQQFHHDYNQFISKVLDKGYAEKVPPSEVNKRDGQVWYIPHHGVYHPRKPGKVRVVFDCSASYDGISLNDLLLPGPNLTNYLIGVLLRFRQESVAIMGDIESMFYQVAVPQEQRNYLRFYWWPNGDLSQKPIPYRMKVHLFGAVSSPSCANYALRLTALSNSHEDNAVATETILRNFYVDDCLKSVKSTEDAVDLIANLTALCKKGGFNLTKWVSNDEVVMQSLPSSDVTKTPKLDMSDPSQLIPRERALGVSWDIESDALGFKIKVPAKNPTRRNILSIVSSVYDPLGFACPVILPVKHLLQKLCKENVDWDTEAKGNDLCIWSQWLMDLPKLEDMTVPRCYKPLWFNISHRQIHSFSDASDKGYGVVSYLRQVSTEGDIHCSFLTARSRVAPLKKITTPRMELTAATVAVRLSKMLEDEMDGEIDDVFFWTDSTAVLKYISSDSARFHTFVSNRVQVIRESSDVSQWRYIDTNTNPADDASRGLQINKFLTNERWLKGPEFLWKEETQWPNRKVFKVDDNDREVKAVSTATAVDEPKSVIDTLLSKYSSWNQLRRIMAWILLAKQ